MRIDEENGARRFRGELQGQFDIAPGYCRPREELDPGGDGATFLPRVDDVSLSETEVAHALPERGQGARIVQQHPAVVLDRLGALAQLCLLYTSPSPRD